MPQWPQSKQGGRFSTWLVRLASAWHLRVTLSREVVLHSQACSVRELRGGRNSTKEQVLESKIPTGSSHTQMNMDQNGPRSRDLPKRNPERHAQELRLCEKHSRGGDQRQKPRGRETQANKRVI